MQMPAVHVRNLLKALLCFACLVGPQFHIFISMLGFIFGYYAHKFEDSVYDKYRAVTAINTKAPKWVEFYPHIDGKALILIPFGFFVLDSWRAVRNFTCKGKRI